MIEASDEAAKRVQQDKELLEVAAEAEAREAKAARKARPVKIKTFEC